MKRKLISAYRIPRILKTQHLRLKTILVKLMLPMLTTLNEGLTMLMETVMGVFFRIMPAGTE